jgi:hypothetical protein
MTYNTDLASIVPAASSFSVLVNSVARTVSTVSVTGTKVQLTLSSGIKFGDIISIAYVKPATSPLQSTTGGLAVNITALTVTNSLTNPAKDAPAVTVTMTLTPSHIHRVVNILLAYSASLATQSAAITPEIIRITNLSGKLYIQKSIATGTTYVKIPLNLKSGIYTIQLTGNGVELASQKMVVY